MQRNHFKASYLGDNEGQLTIMQKNMHLGQF